MTTLKILWKTKNQKKTRTEMTTKPIIIDGKEYVLVPVEPTEEMLDAAGDECQYRKSAHQVSEERWKAMLSAAPQPTLPDDVVKDAERYRWLREQEPSKRDGYAIGYFDTCGVDDWRVMVRDLDDAIDQDIAAQKKE